LAWDSVISLPPGEGWEDMILLLRTVFQCVDRRQPLGYGQVQRTYDLREARTSSLNLRTLPYYLVRSVVNHVLGAPGARPAPMLGNARDLGGGIGVLCSHRHVKYRPLLQEARLILSIPSQVVRASDNSTGLNILSDNSKSTFNWLRALRRPNRKR